MSDFKVPKGWEEVDFHELREGDWILIHTVVSVDAPEPQPGYAPYVRLNLDGNDTFFRKVPSLEDNNFNPGTLVKVTWQADNEWTYRVTKKGNFREVKSGIKIRKENYAFVQKVEVVG